MSATVHTKNREVLGSPNFNQTKRMFHISHVFCNHSVGRQLQTNIPINYSVNVVLKATRYSSFMLSCGVLFYRNKWPGNLSDLRTRILKQNQACGIQIIKPELLCAFKKRSRIWAILYLRYLLCIENHYLTPIRALLLSTQHAGAGDWGGIPESRFNHLPGYVNS